MKIKYSDMLINIPESSFYSIYAEDNDIFCGSGDDGHCFIPCFSEAHASLIFSIIHDSIRKNIEYLDITEIADSTYEMFEAIKKEERIMEKNKIEKARGMIGALSIYTTEELEGLLSIVK